MNFDFNAWIRDLRRRHRLLWGVLSTLGLIVRGAARTLISLGLCFAVFRNILEPYMLESQRLVPHWLPPVFCVVALIILIYNDTRLEYDVMSARGNRSKPSLGHDLALLLTGVHYWVTVCCVLVIFSAQATYLTAIFAPLLPDADPSVHAMLAGVALPALMALVTTVLHLVVLRVWYALTPVDAPVIEPQFPSLFTMVIRGIVWLLVLVLLPFGGWVIVMTITVLTMLLAKYWLAAVILVPCVTALVVALRAWRVYRVRTRCVRQLREELEGAGIRYAFEEHPVRSAFFGGESISLRVFIGDEVTLVRFVPFFARNGTLIVTPDGNVGRLYTLATRLPLRPNPYGYGDGDMGTVQRQSTQPLTQWIRKSETVFSDQRYPDAERVYLITPTPKFWVTGDLKKYVPLDNGMTAYGYAVWTTGAFCRHLRMRQEDFVAGRRGG